MPVQTTVDALLDRYQGMLLDAYGVLVDGTGALPGAAELVRRLEAEGRPWCVVTNDASRSPAACGARYRALGVPVPDHRVLTSGLLLEPFFRNLQGARTLVLGPPDTRGYVRAAGGVDVGPDDAELHTASVIVLGDAGGYDFLPAMDVVLTTALARVEAGLPLHIVIPNPDLIFPKAPAREVVPPPLASRPELWPP